jgi:hypothetical protein
MKLNTTYKFVLLMILISLAFNCSNDDDTGDTTPPGILKVTEITPTNGGGIITYDLPNDEDISYVKAVYTNSLGNEVSKVSSKYNNTIEIFGLNQTTPVDVKLSVFDESNNESSKVPVSFTPLESFIFLVQESISVNADFGGVNINWENIEEKTVFVYVHINDGNSEEVRILSSKKMNENIFVGGLDAIPYEISTKVEDFNGNITSIQSKGSYTPIFEEIIAKDSWSLIANLSINGNAYEGETVNFWDDVVDSVETDADNSYFIINRDDNGGALNFPMDIVIDLNKNVQVRRFKVWQRAFWYQGPTPVQPYYYQSENLKTFDLYSSNDKNTWNLLGQFDIGFGDSNGDGTGSILSEKIDEATNGHDFILDAVSEPFRYLKFSITSNYGSTRFCHGSEITLYGIDNL